MLQELTHITWFCWKPFAPSAPNILTELWWIPWDWKIKTQRFYIRLRKIACPLKRDYVIRKYILQHNHIEWTSLLWSLCFGKHWKPKPIILNELLFFDLSGTVVDVEGVVHPQLLLTTHRHKISPCPRQRQPSWESKVPSPNAHKMNKALLGPSWSVS